MHKNLFCVVSTNNFVVTKLENTKKAIIKNCPHWLIKWKICEIKFIV